MASAALAPEVAALLALFGPPERQERNLSPEQWRRLDAMAQEHRLRPHLHARSQRGEIACTLPPDIAGAWQSAHRSTALAALVQRRDLLEIAALLEREGIRPVALKGAWLAWHAYPSPAERPLRDLDVWVGRADGRKAFDLLLAHGLRPVGKEADYAGTKHFAPLVTQSGTLVEVHSHLWEPPGTMEWPTPPLRAGEFAARAIADGESNLRFLAPQDLLVHLAVHAAYSHRFEVGPLLVADIDYLLAASPIDWPRFWREAADGNYLRGAALCLALCDLWRRPGLVEESGLPIPVDASTLASASALLVQPLDARKSTRSLGMLQESGSLAAAASAGFARLGKLVHDPAKLAQRLSETVSALSEGRVRESATQSAAVGRWLAED